MDWILQLEDGSTYGPLHLLAFSDFLLDGSLDATATVRNTRHNISCPLVEVLLPATIKNNRFLRNSIVKTAEETKSEEAEREPAPPPPEAETESAPSEEAKGDEAGEEDAEVREPVEIPDKEEAAPTERSSDNLRDVAEGQKRVQHWKSLYEEETAKAEKREEELRNQIRELQKDQLALTTELDQVKSELKRQEKKNADFEQFAADGDEEGEDQVKVLKSQFKSLLDSYNDLSKQYERISSQISDQSEELEKLRAAKSAIQEKADKRLQDMSEELQRERKEADEAKAKLSEAEKNYTDLVRSYREMNDKLVKLRQEMA